jgi:uncharacterized protein (UPF0210 family)
MLNAAVAKWCGLCAFRARLRLCKALRYCLTPTRLAHGSHDRKLLRRIYVLQLIAQETGVEFARSMNAKCNLKTGDSAIIQTQRKPIMKDNFDIFTLVRAV